MPENYGYTRAAQLLRVCERFGMNPLTWIEELGEHPPEVERLLAEYESLRSYEEASETRAIVEALAAAFSGKRSRSK